MPPKKKTTVIRRVTDEEDNHEHHGGHWKVAYADFVTAMMAFFMLMWLLTVADEEQLTGIAGYFTPNMPFEGGIGALAGQSPADNGVMTNRVDVSPSEAPPEPTVPQDAWSQLIKGDGDRPDLGESEAVGEATDLQKFDAERLAEMQDRIEGEIVQDPELSDLAGSIDFKRVEDGLLIEIMDQQNKPMFALGSSKFDAGVSELVTKVGIAIKALPNSISITGHTDATPYKSEIGYTNWELSSDRAQATRRLLRASGVDEARFASVSGRAATQPRVPDEPNDPSNRRVNIHLKFLDTPE